jgi:hypothetical protein
MARKGTARALANRHQQLRAQSAKADLPSPGSPGYRGHHDSTFRPAWAFS